MFYFKQIKKKLLIITTALSTVIILSACSPTVPSDATKNPVNQSANSTPTTQTANKTTSPEKTAKEKTKALSETTIKVNEKLDEIFSPESGLF